MSVDSTIDAALRSTGLPLHPNEYAGPDLEYLTWSYTQIPEVPADDAPHAARYLITVRYYLPFDQNPNGMKRAISWALFRAECTWPSITNISDQEGQAYALECEWTDGGGYYGSDQS